MAGMMGTFGSSMAGSMAGSMLGNAMFGGHGSSAPAAVAPAAEGQAAVPQYTPPVCSFETQQFLACMAQTGDNMDHCRQIFDQFRLCNMQAGQPQQQRY